MKGKCLDYVRGHMGGNTISLFPGEQFTPGKELEEALIALDEKHIFSDEAAIISPSIREKTLKIQIVSPTTKRFITACGGMTQVLGKALGESYLGEKFGFTPFGDHKEIFLEIEGSIHKIDIFRQGNKVFRTLTNMDMFADELYFSGIEEIRIMGVRVFRVGKFLVVNADEIKKTFPSLDLDEMDHASKNILFELQQKAMSFNKAIGFDYAVYDWNSVHKGNMRAVFPHYIPDDHIEPSCGTGTVAIAVATAWNGELQDNLSGYFPDTGMINLALETGGEKNLGGPELSNISFSLAGNKLKDIHFHHNLVELTSQGKIFI